MCAELGFNVILLDSDDGSHILTQVSQAAKKRIFHLLIKDEIDRQVASIFMTLFLKGRKFLWDEQGKTRVVSPSVRNKEHSFVWCDFTKLTANDVLVIDSHTANVISLGSRWYQERGINIDDAALTKGEIDLRDFYGYTGTISTFWIKQLKALPCHVILICHQQIYEKRKTINEGGKKREIVEWTRTQPISTSGPNAMTLAKEFSEILYFYMRGRNVKISTEAEEGRDGGCRILPPKVWQWDELTFKTICEICNYKIPAPDAPLQSALEWFPPGAEIPFIDNKPEPTVLNPKQPTGVLKQPDKAKISLGGLLTKKG